MALITPVFVNNFYTTLASSVASGATTTFSLTSTAGLPALGTNEYIPIVVVDTTTTPETIIEYCYITAIAGSNITVTRGAEDSTRYPAGALANSLTVAAVATGQTLKKVKTIRIPHTFAVMNTLAVDTTPVFYVSLPAGQTAAIAMIRYSVSVGTATFTVEKNGAAAHASYTNLTATTTDTNTTQVVSLADNDEIRINITGVSSGEDLSVTVFVEYTVQ